MEDPFEAELARRQAAQPAPAPDPFEAELARRQSGAAAAPTPTPQDGGLWPAIKREAGNAYVAAHDIGRIMLDAGTLGLADRAASYVKGTPLEAERADTAKSKARAGLAGDVAGVVGTLAPIGAAGKVVGAARVAPGVVGRVLANPYVESALTGAGVGGGEAAGHGEDIATGAALGGAAGLGGQAVAHGVTSAVQGVSKALNRPVPPSADDIRAAMKAGYDKAENSGLVLTPEGTGELSRRLEDALRAGNYNPDLNPYGGAIVREAGRVSGKGVPGGGYATAQDIENTRRVASKAFGSKSAEADDRNIARQAVNAVDDLIADLPSSPQFVAAGDPVQAALGAQEGRRNASMLFKDDAVGRALETARLRAASTGSGGNINNATRQEFRKLLGNGQPWTPDELAAIEQVAAPPNKLDDALRLAGKLAPGGNGLMLALHGGALGASAAYDHGAPSPWAFAPAIVGMLAKKGADARTLGRALKVSDLVLSGGNAAALQPPVTAVQTAAGNARKPLADVLMSLGLIGGQ